MRLDQAARSILLTDFVSAFFLAMRYFFRSKATLNYPFEKGAPWLHGPEVRRTGAYPRVQPFDSPLRVASAISRPSSCACRA